jgi:hypothetical protein
MIAGMPPPSFLHGSDGCSSGAGGEFPAPATVIISMEKRGEIKGGEEKNRGGGRRKER